MLDVYVEESVIENWFASPSGRPGPALARHGLSKGYALV